MNHEQALIQAITLTDEIFKILDSGSFDRVEELESKQQPLIKKAFSDSVHQLDQNKARHLQKPIDQVVARLTLFKESGLVQQSNTRKAVKAMRAYQEQVDT